MTIKLIVIDVDGTLTDGGITYGSDDELKTFNAKDGLIISAMSRFGIKVAFLTGRSSESVSRRASELNAIAFQGIQDKSKKLREMSAEYNLRLSEVAYIGDDLNDYAAMRLCGFKGCPADATEEIKAICDYVSTKSGGYGAVRNICEKILCVTGLSTQFYNLYLNEGTENDYTTGTN